MKIGILRGFFNPIHNGHIKVAQKVKDELGLDQVWFVPVFQDKTKSFHVEKIKASQRYKMTKYAVEETEYDWLKVKPYEMFSLSSTYGSLKSYVRLTKIAKKAELFFIMGDNRYAHFIQTKEYEQIKNDIKVVVVNKEAEGSALKIVGDNIIHINNFNYSMSSEKALSLENWSYIPNAAKEYISDNGLYLKTIAFNTLKEKRYQHSISVASHAKRLAMANDYKNKAKIAEIAGLAHDLFKYVDTRKQLRYVTDNTAWELPPEPALHGYSAAIWMSEEYMIKNRDMLNAIKYHTTARAGMSKLEKIVYVADKIASDRKGHFYGRRRKLAYSNLELAFEMILKEEIDMLRKKGIEPHRYTLEAYEETRKSKPTYVKYRRQKSV